MDGKALLEGMDCDISTHEYVHYELEFYLNNPHVLNEEAVWKLMVQTFLKMWKKQTYPKIVVPWVLFLK
jgi:hypothetical protein